jgi:hypothetical protein
LVDFAHVLFTVRAGWEGRKEGGKRRERGGREEGEREEVEGLSDRALLLGTEVGMAGDF